MRKAEDYLDLPYHFTLVFSEADEWSGWFIKVQELDGCMSQGRTPDEAIERVKDAMLGWIDVALQDGDEIPLPRSDEYSGRFLVRMPESLHARIADEAREEDVSLNQLVTNALAGAVGWGRPREPGPESAKGTKRTAARARTAARRKPRTKTTS